MAATAAVPLSAMSSPLLSSVVAASGDPRVAVLLVDTDRAKAPIDERIYGQFLEHIDHSVVDGLFAEQIRGAGSRAKTSRLIGSRSQTAAGSRLRTSNS